MTAAAAASYLDGLNPEQRRAVEHGVLGGTTIDVPLLVIAGAGSGKTATLASRVAHLPTPAGPARKSEIRLRDFLSEYALPVEGIEDRVT